MENLHRGDSRWHGPTGKWLLLDKRNAILYHPSLGTPVLNTYMYTHTYIYIYTHVCIQKYYHVFPVWRELLKNSRHLQVVWAVLMTNEDFPGSSILLDVRQSEMDTSERLQRGTLVLGCCLLRTTHEISPKDSRVRGCLGNGLKPPASSNFCFKLYVCSSDLIIISSLNPGCIHWVQEAK